MNTGRLQRRADSGANAACARADIRSQPVHITGDDVNLPDPAI